MLFWVCFPENLTNSFIYAFDSARIQRTDQFGVSWIDFIRVSNSTSIELCLSSRLCNQNQATVSHRGLNSLCDWFAMLHCVWKLLNLVTIAQYSARWPCQLVAVIAASNLQVFSGHIRHAFGKFCSSVLTEQSFYSTRNIIRNFFPLLARTYVNMRTITKHIP